MSKSFADYQMQVQQNAFPAPSEEEIAAQEAQKRTDAQALGMELLHIETHLRKHGAGIATLLRHTAKASLGIDVPALPALKQAVAKTIAAVIGTAFLFALIFPVAGHAASYNGSMHYGPGGALLGQAVSQAAPGTSITGSTTETVLATIAIPPNMAGPNARILVRTYWNMTNTNSTKTTKVYLNSSAAAGGTAYLSDATASGTLSAQFNTVIMNVGATNSQTGGIASGTAFTSTGGVLPTGAIDMTQPSWIVISCTLGSGSDVCELAGYQVELLP